MREFNFFWLGATAANGLEQNLDGLLDNRVVAGLELREFLKPQDHLLEVETY